MVAGDFHLSWGQSFERDEEHWLVAVDRGWDVLRRKNSGEWLSENCENTLLWDDWESTSVTNLGWSLFTSLLCQLTFAGPLSSHFQLHTVFLSQWNRAINILLAMTNTIISSNALAVNSGNIVPLISSSVSETIHPNDNSILSALHTRLCADFLYMRIGMFNLVIHQSIQDTHKYQQYQC